MNYSLVNKEGRFLATSYSSYGGRLADLCSGEWVKQPKRWQTYAGAQKYRDTHDWLKGYDAVPTPLTRHERRELLEQHGVEMLTTLGEVVERLSLWNEHLPDGPRQKADEFKAKVNNLVLRATGGAS